MNQSACGLIKIFLSHKIKYGIDDGDFCCEVVEEFRE